uniref:ABC-type xenobiotic transporter n=1 Tax=Strigamia maritima TaxID=126957 RepID=T1JDG5_STRMM
MTYGSFSLAFWYGVKLFFDSHRDGSYEYDASTIIIVFFSALMGAMMIGQGSPFLEAINVARTGAATVFQVIHRVPTIDSSSIQGDRPPCLIGDIHFKDIHFNYPSRSEVNILNGLDFKIASGQTVALVGKSGCGKSTLIQLVQRMYDVTEGSVRIDGKDVRRFNVRWLRERIGVVGQEPVLFGMSISENIRLGCEGITQEQIELASKAANAHDFIMKMPKVRYDTLVGDRGSQLSGGQKQRIAIARALVKNPRILLLDEATSALDSESEGIVQAALDKVRKGRTTLIVAHRLTTVRTADVICVINDGQVAEHGTHDDLMNHRGLYYELVQTQQQSGEEQDENEIEEIHEMNEKGERKLSYQRRPTVTSINSGSFMGRSMSIDHQTPEDEEEDQDILKPPLFRIIKLNSPEWPYILLGCFGAIGFGCTTPVYALLFGDIMGVLSITVENEARKESEFYAILFVVLGLWAGISCFLQMYMFAVAGDKLTARIRKLTFASILNQECGWFDEPKNSTGALCTRLAVDAANVQGATGSRIGILLQSFSTVIIALVFALVLVWKQALVTAVFMPLVLIATYYQGKFMMGHNDKEIKAQESCGKIASEAINNIRTVASLSREDKFKEMYAEGLIQSRLNYWKVVQVRGIIFGVSQSLPCVSYAASMWYGGYLIEKEGVPYEDVFKIAELLIFGMMMIGQSVAMAPNYNKGLMSAGRIFQLLDRKPLTTKSGTGLKLGDFSDASVEFEEIKFSYPSRSQAQILKGLNIKVENGITVALVGNSGCGKSTCVQLLERFYDPSHGNVRLGGHNINDLNVSWLRDQIGLVSQEPVLFDCSIMDNIAYGCNNRKVHIDEVIQAAKQANIHNFISACRRYFFTMIMCVGYNTSVGSKGTQGIGGQKQRIAIARALLRNPKILLLDEATSALDSESEKLVQEALDKASKNRTTIIIAHRLSTIQNAD